MKEYDVSSSCWKCQRVLTNLNTGKFGDECKECEGSNNDK